MRQFIIAWFIVMVLAAVSSAQELGQDESGLKLAQLDAPENFRIAGKGHVIWMAPSTQKVKQDEAPSGKVSSVTLAAARNEFESLQVVVYGRNRLKKVDAEFSDLKGPNGAVIPSSAGVLYRVNYVDCADQGFLPDSMVPFIDPVSGDRITTEYGAPFDVEKGKNVPIWLEIHVPEDAEPGQYTGTVTITQDGEKIGTVPIKLTVWPFTLPKTTELLTYFCLSWNEHPKRAYMHSLHEHRIDVWYLQSRRHLLERDNSGNAVVKWEPEFDQKLEDYFDGSLFEDGVPGKTYLFGYGMWPLLDALKKNEKDRIAILKQFEEHYRDKPYIKKIAWFFIDEPSQKSMARVKQVAEQVKEYSPSIPFLLTTGFTEDLKGLVDIWDPIINREIINWDSPGPKVYRDEIAAGRHAINCITVNSKNPTCPNLFIQFSGMNTRIWTWATWELGLEGIEFWDTKPAPSVTNAISYADAWGDGSMFYRGLTGELGIDEEIPLPSIRLKMLRDGIEDYELLAMLKKKDPKAAERIGNMMCQATESYDKSFAKPVQHTSWNWNTDGKGSRRVPGHIIWESSYDRLTDARAALAKELAP